MKISSSRIVPNSTYVYGNIIGMFNEYWKYNLILSYLYLQLECSASSRVMTALFRSFIMFESRVTSVSK